MNLVEEGFIGSLSNETYTFMGGGGNVEIFKNKTGPEIARKLKDQGVDIVLCTGGCGTCHRSATIVTRCCEEEGMSCVVIAALPPIARQQGAPRITAPHVPIGSNAGEPNNKPMQRAIVKESLEWVRDCPSYNQMKVLPYEYRHKVFWKGDRQLPGRQFSTDLAQGLVMDCIQSLAVLHWKKDIIL